MSREIRPRGHAWGQEEEELQRAENASKTVEERLRVCIHLCTSMCPRLMGSLESRPGLQLDLTVST